MDKPFYNFQILEEKLGFDFVSEGEKTIRKVIFYKAIPETSFFQLALVNVMDDGSFSDSVRSNNGDRNKVLATVIQTFRFFFEQYPEATIVFQEAMKLELVCTKESFQANRKMSLMNLPFWDLIEDTSNHSLRIKVIKHLE